MELILWEDFHRKRESPTLLSRIALWGSGEVMKVAIPESVEDDSQKIQGGNGQGKSGSPPLDGFLKGFEGALF
jgi:hypothetical protein